MSGKRKKPRSMRLRRKDRQRGGAHKAFAAMFAVLGIVVMSSGFIGTPAQAEGGGGQDNLKVFVCKYVGQPGTDERLQTGDNPISVSVNSIPNYQGVGSYFADQHGRSFVLAVDDTPPGPAGDPGVGACPAPEGPPTDACPDLPGNQPEGTDCTPPPVDVCDNLPGNQPEGTDCTPPPTDACPNLEGNQPPGTDCNPPTDACPDLPGQQEPGTDCTPPPTDVCPDLPGNQPEGTDCTPPPVDVCDNLPGNQPEGTDCTPPVDECPPLTGSVKTTLADGSVVNGNIYDAKADVYVYGDQLGDATKVYVRVTDPSGSTVLSSVKEVTVTNGSFDPVQLPTFSDTPNNGDEYKVWVSTSSDFESNKCTKFDNFKVRGETPPERVVTASPNQGSCEVRLPQALVTTDFASSIGYRLVGLETVFVHREVPAGTYTVTLPLLQLGDSIIYEIVVTPLDDSAQPIVKGPFTFSVPTDCGSTPPCTEYQDENPSAACYVEREPDVRRTSSERESCRLGGVETTTTVFTTTYAFNEATQQWGSSEAATSSQSFTPYTKAELKQKGCVKQPGTPPPGSSNTPTTAHTGLWTDDSARPVGSMWPLLSVSAVLTLLSGLFFYGAWRRGQTS